MYEKDMADYKNKKLQQQKELESVYYGLAERSLKQMKSAEEEFLQKQDELKNSVSYKSYYFFIGFTISNFKACMKCKFIFACTKSLHFSKESFCYIVVRYTFKI